MIISSLLIILLGGVSAADNTPHDAIMNMGIVMDSGEFVGSVHEKMDSTLVIIVQITLFQK